MNTPVLPRWWAFAIIALILANLISLFVFWRHQSHQPPPPREPIGKGLHHLLQSIGYSPAQLAQVDVLRDEHEKNMQPLLENKRKYKEALFSLTGKQTVADSELNEAAIQVANNEQALDKQTFHFIKQVRALANEQQAKQFDSTLRQMIGALVGGGAPPMRPPMQDLPPQENSKPGSKHPYEPAGVPGPPTHRNKHPEPPPPPPGGHDGPP
ncbi:MAG: hypothetical protein FGM61_03215, partial [Sediminibacterium sp.]|nr:hypothetical protein [Sediminibacterium sp.]